MCRKHLPADMPESATYGLIKALAQASTPISRLHSTSDYAQFEEIIGKVGLENVTAVGEIG